MGKNRLTKQQMKTDELQHALVDARDYVATHKGQTTRLTIAGVVAVAVVIAAVFLVRFRNERLGRQLSDAIATFDAPLVTEGTAPAGQKVYKDEAERLADAKKKLEALAKDAPGSAPGRAAALMVMSLDGAKGTTGTAVDAVKAFVNQEEGTVAAGIAAVSLLDAQAAAGRTTEAIAQAKQYLEAAKSPVPKDVLLLTLARLHEKAGQVAEAKSYYQRVVSDYPESNLRFDAQQRLTGL
jgi:tetratricopeptide (TPR) repeat protein